jgi:hypothetical protein
MSNLALFTQGANVEYVITLKEITDLIDVRHNDSMRKVEGLAKEDGFGQLRKTRISIPKGNGASQEIITYQFTKKQAIAVGARLNNTMLMKVINRLEELEMAKPKPLPLSRKELALMVIEQEERIEELERTKAQISQKREATAMATASAQKRRAEKLEVELDKSKKYCTIKRMTMLTHGQKYSYKLLREVSNEMNLETLNVFDANYGTVKAYHRDAWAEAYGLEF